MTDHLLKGLGLTDTSKTSSFYLGGDNIKMVITMNQRYNSIKP